MAITPYLLYEDVGAALRFLAIRIALSGVTGKSQSLQAGKLTLELDARQGETTVKGNLASSLAANLEKQTVELPAFSGELDVANPQMPMKSVKLPLTGGLPAYLDWAAAECAVAPTTSC